jgi:hypothetical protein
VIEVLETGWASDEMEIDRQTNNADLNGADKRKSFTILQSVAPFQFIRLRNTGPDHQEDHYVFLSD